jgi:membrane protease YdiL (CAAX protease family)
MESDMIFWLCALALRTCVVGKQAWWFDLVLSVGGIVFAWRGLYDFQFSVDVAFLPVELVLGLVLFILSVLITARDPIRHLRATLESLLGSRRSVHRQAICGAIKTSIAEEVVWRVILQTALSSIGGPVVAVVVVALVFSSLHRRATGGLSWQLIDVFIFSLCLGWLLVKTHDVLAVIIVHAVRNYLIGVQRNATARYQAQRMSK